MRSTSALRAGEVGWLTLSPKPREILMVPAAAVVDGPAGTYVLVAAPERNSVSPRAVTLGRISNGTAALVSGVREGEQVVARGTFFLDAERLLVAGHPEGSP